MAKEKTEATIEETPLVSPIPQPQGDVNPGYKIITNLQPCPQHIPLTDGTGIDLGPKLSSNRTSAPILGKLLPFDFIKRLVHEKKLRIEG